MTSRSPWLTLGLALLLLLAAVPPARAAAPNPVAGQGPARTIPQALVIYDGTSRNDHEGVIGAANIANLLGHFGYTAVTVPIEQYRPGDLARYPATFVIVANETTEVPDALLRDARTTTHPLCWIDRYMDRLLAAEGRRGVVCDGYLADSRYRQVRYHGVTLGKGTGELARLTITDPALARVEAVALDPEGREAPYIVHAGPLWLIGDQPFAYVDEHDRYLAFCDLVHDMLGVAHPSGRRALIRIEDVNPEDDPAAVKRAADVCAAEGVAFQIALIPIFNDPSAGTEVYLSDRPAFVEALHYAVARGATIVLHGATHQLRGVSADDFEFWDELRNRPIPGDSPELVRRKITLALDECFRNGIYPLAWEMPHYMASILDYREVAKIFSTVNERAPTIEGDNQFFPYTTTDALGQFVVPENLGFLPAADPQPGALVEKARALLAVRDGIASAFIHDFLDPRYLRDTIRGVRGLGYQFVSLRAFPCQVRDGDRLVQTGTAPASVALENEYLHQFLLRPDGSRAREMQSTRRASGVQKVSLLPASDEVLVVEGLAELPVATRPTLGTRVQSLFARLRGMLASRSPVPPHEADPMRVTLLWDAGARGEEANDQESFRAVFEAYGVHPNLLARQAFNPGAFPAGDLLVVPHPAAVALRADQVAAIGRFVREGGGLILDDRTPLTEALGIRYEQRELIGGSIRDTAAPELTLLWRPRAPVPGVRLPAGAIALARDSVTGAVLAAAVPFGAGKALYLATRLDPFTPDGTSRYPFLFESALDTFRRAQIARRPTVELYFDPGLRQGVSLERLVLSWRRLGVRVIYAAAWEFYLNYTFDYPRLLRLCHANGILVYAWFEFPQVSPRFWEEHPEWREIPAVGPGRASWRYAMNLANATCRAATLEFMTDILARWPWDGANLAELNFDADGGAAAPARFTPMNDDVRHAFADEAGFDPRQLFDARSPHWWQRDSAGWARFLRFRTDLVTRLHREFLTALRPFADSGHEIIVTALDSLESPQVTADNGLDSAAIVSLMREFDFTLQIEDPAVAWVRSPRRYQQLAARYRPLLPPGRRLMFDINVVPDRNVEASHLPVAAAAGTELAATLRWARAASGRVALYGDATVRTRDLELASYAFAGDAHVVRDGVTWSVGTEQAIEVAVPTSLHDFYLDGVVWPYWRSGFVLVPPGDHVLSAYRPWLRLLDLSALRLHLFRFNGSLEAARGTRDSLRFSYNADGRALAVIGRRPARVEIDGREASELFEGPDHDWVLALPRGRHNVQIVGSSRGAAVLDLASLLSSSLIVAFGSAASLMLAVLYAGIRIRRAFSTR